MVLVPIVLIVVAKYHTVKTLLEHHRQDEEEAGKEEEPAALLLSDVTKMLHAVDEELFSELPEPREDIVRSQSVRSLVIV